MMVEAEIQQQGAVGVYLQRQQAFAPLLITQRTCLSLRVSTDLTLIQFDPRPKQGGLWSRCR